MYELIQVSERDYYIQCPAKIGLIRLSDRDVCRISTGRLTCLVEDSMLLWRRA